MQLQKQLSSFSVFKSLLKFLPRARIFAGSGQRQHINPVYNAQKRWADKINFKISHLSPGDKKQSSIIFYRSFLYSPPSSLISIPRQLSVEDHILPATPLPAMCKNSFAVART